MSSKPHAGRRGDGRIESGDDIDSSRTLIERPVLLVSNLTRAIDRLNHYRSALITAAVIGQIDVLNHREETPCP
jgi:hypothetical protein